MSEKFKRLSWVGGVVGAFIGFIASPDNSFLDDQLGYPVIGFIIAFILTRLIGWSISAKTNNEVETTTAEPLNSEDEFIYAKITEEIANRAFDPASISRAHEKAEGNEKKSESFYIKFRYAQLKQELKQQEIARLEAEKRKKSGGCAIFLIIIFFIFVVIANQ